jgi:hypothetical protein
MELKLLSSIKLLTTKSSLKGECSPRPILQTTKDASEAFIAYILRIPKICQTDKEQKRIGSRISLRCSFVLSDSFFASSTLNMEKLLSSVTSVNILPDCSALHCHFSKTTSADRECRVVSATNPHGR